MVFSGSNRQTRYSKAKCEAGTRFHFLTTNSVGSMFSNMPMREIVKTAARWESTDKHSLKRTGLGIYRRPIDLHLPIRDFDRIAVEACERPDRCLIARLALLRIILALASQ